MSESGFTTGGGNVTQQQVTQAQQQTQQANAASTTAANTATAHHAFLLLVAEIMFIAILAIAAEQAGVGRAVIGILIILWFIFMITHPDWVTYITNTLGLAPS